MAVVEPVDLNDTRADAFLHRPGIRMEGLALHGQSCN